MTWREIESAGRAAFDSFPTCNSMKSWKRKTEGVDPANRAPALLPHWTGGGNRASVSPEAWASLVRMVKLSGKNGTGYGRNTP